MSLRKFVAEGFSYGAGRIDEQTVERETGESVWVGGNRRGKRTEFTRYFDTWEEAHAFLMQRAQARVEAARRDLAHANDKLSNVKGMRPPVHSEHA